MESCDECKSHQMLHNQHTAKRYTEKINEKQQQKPPIDNSIKF